VAITLVLTACPLLLLQVLQLLQATGAPGTCHAALLDAFAASSTALHVGCQARMPVLLLLVVPLLQHRMRLREGLVTQRAGRVSSSCEAAPTAAVTPAALGTPVLVPSAPVLRPVLLLLPLLL
jgi:hypothetical protein